MTESEVLYVRSSKKNNSKPSGGDSSTNEDDIWDDTLLVEAYDRAVEYAQQNCMKKKQLTKKASLTKVKPNGNDSHIWKIGDRCRCQYSEDLNYYEADIIDIIDTKGLCVVKYVGYANEESVPLTKLKPSEGDFARFRQIQQAAAERGDQNPKNEKLDRIDNELCGGIRKNQKKPPAKKRDKFLKNDMSCPEASNSFVINSSLPKASLTSIIPPPPPPHVFNNTSDDENENEAMSAMLMSWYMSGYHTGYYQGLKVAKKQEQ